MKTRKQKAGKYVGQGAYGCGFYPALRCEGEDTRAPGLFSKLMLRSEAVLEYKQYDLLFPLDPEQHYLLYPLKYCKPNPITFTSGEPNNNTSECDGIFSNIETEGRLLMYKNGGPDLTKMNVKASEYSAFFRDLLQLFEGLKVMHDGEVAHLDIKTPNVVHQLVSSKPPMFHFRYIDFGLSRNMSDPVESRSVLEATYFAYPYELRFVSPDFQKRMINNTSIRDYISTNYNFKLAYYVPENVMWAKVNGGRITWEYNDYVELYNNYLIGKANLQEKADIFALGRLLASVYGQLTGHTSRLNGIMIPEKPVEGDIREIYFIERVPISSIANEESRLWHQRVADEISTPLYNIISDMMDFDFTVRISLKQAMEAYSALIPRMLGLFTPRNIEKHMSVIFPNLKPDTFIPTPKPQPVSSFPPGVLRSYSTLIPSQVEKRRYTMKNKKTLTRQNAHRNLTAL